MELKKEYVGDNIWVDLVKSFDGVYSDADVDVLTKKLKVHVTWLSL